MRSLFLTDVTLTRADVFEKMRFRDKLDYIRLINRLGIDRIELPPIRNGKADFLFIRSAAQALENVGISVPVSLDLQGMEELCDALRDVKEKTLIVSAPVSSVQMEYIGHKKPELMKAAILKAVTACRERCDSVEFIAEDATRSDRSFLASLLSDVIVAGVTEITLCDISGRFLADEFGTFVSEIFEEVPGMNSVRVGVRCSNDISMADACAVKAIASGATAVKACSFGNEEISMESLMKVFAVRKESLGMICSFRTEEIRRVSGSIHDLFVFRDREPAVSVDPSSAADRGRFLTSGETKDSLRSEVTALGYDLSEQDFEKVWTAFNLAAAKKNEITSRELDAMIAAEAMQVEPACKIISYVINTGNIISAMAHMKLEYRGRVLEGISVGDGAIDAAFLAIEKTVGRHFELDDFQIRAISEGREAMGESVVKLRSQGKLYSGRGISTDIVGSGVMAYVNALNKILFEEEEA